ncbi:MULTISPECIES: carbohydrate ABC transporter permease [unclassified Rathayibacter]|uniref:carbohydrate ABC transporter permease n=1 Tax=unclassified Rathayibacter TaxID=2609250 RepID=UPI000F4C3FDB|nr:MULTISPECIES: sugar ABC transporter permease [unclassified Rathayibacter]ROP49099.1 multiple sugar transport system permease protein [Rathayibacter sp. PhB186]ROS50784.1 multiple sugar transport system permease protein [Rathayibacter sp. PhB185]
MTAHATAPAPARRAPERRRASPATRQKTLAAYGFVAPFMIVFALMLVVPLVYAFWLSLYRVQLVGGQSFVGLANYARALTDPDFLGGLGRVALFLVLQVPVMLALALVFALILDTGRLRLSGFVRLSIFLPYAIPGVIAALMWGYLYGQDFGPFAQIARSIGLPAPAFLSSEWVLGSIANIVTWSFVGYNMIVIYAALRSIPEELYDAARMDGAGAIRVAWSIKIPAVRPALILSAIFSVIGSFQLFTEPQLLKAIAPTVIDGSFTPNLYAYTLAFGRNELNYAAAVSFLLGFVIMVVSYVVQLSTTRKERSR